VIEEKEVLLYTDLIFPGCAFSFFLFALCTTTWRWLNLARTQLTDTGSVAELEIGHTGPHPWAVKEVQITNVNTGASATFNIDR
jgi:hypothetical protein